jgi:PAS domain-containing protein
MRDDGGQAVALIGSLSDVTDRKEAEEALHQKMDELERFQRLTVGRELRMVEMKNEINALLAQAGQPAKYPLLPERQG